MIPQTILNIITWTILTTVTVAILLATIKTLRKHHHTIHNHKLELNKLYKKIRQTRMKEVF